MGKAHLPVLQDLQEVVGREAPSLEQQLSSLLQAGPSQHQQLSRGRNQQKVPELGDSGKHLCHAASTGHSWAPATARPEGAEALGPLFSLHPGPRSSLPLPVPSSPRPCCLVLTKGLCLALLLLWPKHPSRQ